MPQLRLCTSSAVNLVVSVVSGLYVRHKVSPFPCFQVPRTVEFLPLWRKVLKIGVPCIVSQ